MRQGVVSICGDGLDSFLASLAADWQGWEGTRTWNTLEHGMSIEANHEGNASNCSSSFAPVSSGTNGKYVCQFA
jgi:hypothetical protein